MGNDPGKTLPSANDTSRVVIDIKGPFNPDDAKTFKDELMKLIDKYKGKWGRCDLPIKKP
jgi:hypothetical protein